jgi:polyhydroxybutyrate depolymerase
VRRAWLVGLLLAPVLAACGGGHTPPPRPVALDAATVTCSAAKRRPLLVVIMPGGQGDPDDRLGLRRAARRAGIATLYPETEHRFWPLNDQQGVGDVGAVSSLLDHKLENGCYDERRLAIAGVSNGAGFAVRLGCAQADRFAAVVAVAVGLRALAPCPPQARASFLEIHGSADTVTPYRGVPPDRRGSVPRFAAAWARRAGCAARPRTTYPAGGVTRTAYRACAGGRHVETILLAGTDHGWPGAGPPLPRRNPSGFDATPAVIDFIRRAPPSR